MSQNEFQWGTDWHFWRDEQGNVCFAERVYGGQSMAVIPEDDWRSIVDFLDKNEPPDLKDDSFFWTLAQSAFNAVKVEQQASIEWEQLTDYARNGWLVAVKDVFLSCPFHKCRL